MSHSYYRLVRGMAAVQSAWCAWLVRQGQAEEKPLHTAAAFLEKVFLNRLVVPEFLPPYAGFLAWAEAESGAGQPALFEPLAEALVTDWGGRLMLRLDLEALYSILRGHAAAGAGAWIELAQECRNLLPALNRLPLPDPAGSLDGQCLDWLVSYLASYTGLPFVIGRSADLDRVVRLAERAMLEHGEPPVQTNLAGLGGVARAHESVIAAIKQVAWHQGERVSSVSGLGAPTS